MKFPHHVCRVIVGIYLALSAASVFAAVSNWPQFRGPGALGVADNPNLPDRWSTNENVAWKIEVPGRGWSAPIVWGDRVAVPLVVIPQRGKKNSLETQRESGKQFVALRHQVSSVESEINSLEQHGLNRCLNVGIKCYQRYVGCGALSDNLHVIGRELLAREQAHGETLALAA